MGVGTVIVALLTLVTDAGVPGPLELTPTAYRRALTKEGAWTVVEIEASSRLYFLPRAVSNPVLFLGRVGCTEAWRGKRLWCVVPEVDEFEKQVLVGPVDIPVGIAPEKIERWRADAVKRGQRTWKLSGLHRGAPLQAEDRMDLVKRLELGLAPLRLETISVRDAKTSTGMSLEGGWPITDWTVITATANFRPPHIGGNAFDPVHILGESACIEVWRGHRLSCIVPAVGDARALELWGPVEVPTGMHGPFKRQKRAVEVFALQGAPTRPKLEAPDINSLIAQIRGDPDL